MSKAVRVRDHLHAEIERLAKENRRTIIDQLELLLEQAIAMTDGLSEAVRPEAGDRLAGVRHGSGEPGRKLGEPAASESPDDHFKPDFGGKLK